MKDDAHTRHPELGFNSPEVVFDELRGLLRHSIENHPRTLQARIGPSEIGEPCPRALIAALFNLPGPPEPPNLRAWVGTQIHAGLEQIVRKVNDPAEPRYLLERKVTVGAIGGVPITGSVDVFDVLSGTVVDYKSKSKTRLLDHRRHGPGPTYETQAQLYGLGISNAGYHVNQVMFLFLPRDGEFADIFFRAAPFDPQIGLAALTRANQLHALATLLGPRAAMDAYPLCDGEFCRHCKTRDLTGLVGLIAPAAQTAA